MTSTVPQATIDKATRIIHLALVAERFQTLEPHPAYLEPDSDDAIKAQRIVAHLLAEGIITQDDTGNSEITTQILGTKKW